MAIIVLVLPKTTLAASWVSTSPALNGNTINALTTGTDGKIWAAGNNNYTAYWDGSKWININPTLNGYNGFNIKALTTGTDGKIYAAGFFNWYNLSACWNGSSWINTYSMGPYWENPKALTTGKDGKIYAAGTTGYIYYWNGSSWVSLKQWKSYSCTIYALTTGTDGKIWAAGDNGYSAYWNGSSWIDTGQVPGGYPVTALTTGTDGKIWAAESNGATAYWDGSSWVSTGSWPQYGISITALTTGMDGKIWAAGIYGYTAYWNGSSWVNTGQWPYGANYSINALTVGADGKIWAAGDNGYTAYFSTDNNLSLVPSPNGMTGQLVINPRIWGSTGLLVALQGSTDNVNFSDLGVPGAGTILVNINSNTYYVRAVLQREITQGQFQSFYSNTVAVPTLIPPNVSTNFGIVSWDATRGRSWIKLTWPVVPNATGYKLWVFDGNVYRVKDLGNVTSWDSRTAKIFPFPSELPENNSVSTDLFRWDGSGLDLEDTALRLYKTTIGLGYDTYNNYWFRVTAYNQWMESDFNAAVCILTPTLPNATDATSPSGSVSVLSTAGLKKTYDQSVNVTVSASDNQSGIYQIFLSNDNNVWTPVYTAAKNSDNSTGVTSYSNTFSWNVTPGAGTKTVYVKVVDSVGNASVCSDSIALADDVLPPNVSLMINGGASSTTTSLVTLTVTATDNSSAPSQMQMRLSNNGILWTPWQAYQQTLTWDITNASYGGTSIAGIKSVYVEVADAAQNYSMATAIIGYNPTPPSGTVSIAGAISGTYNGQQAWFTNNNDLILNLNFSGAAKIRTAVNGMPWSDWQPYSTSFETALPISQGLAIISLQVADAYGVVGQQQTVRVLIDSQPPVISKLRGYNGLTATSSTSVTLEIQASDNLPGTLQYQYQVNGGSWSSWGALSGNTISVSGLASGANNINVNVKDQAGNIASASTTVFRI
ncbi:hypothetical protein SDD30_16255 [Moorella naiadis]|uniref:hypothetical protein n=1 Tax=Moorella naiadis (nom. illeg.) TaxID=3093670 RepID=UPI003D9C8C27